MADRIERAVAGHYGVAGLRERLFEAMGKAGLDPNHLTPAEAGQIALGLVMAGKGG